MREAEITGVEVAEAEEAEETVVPAANDHVPTKVAIAVAANDRASRQESDDGGGGEDDDGKGRPELRYRDRDSNPRLLDSTKLTDNAIFRCSASLHMRSPCLSTHSRSIRPFHLDK